MVSFIWMGGQIIEYRNMNRRRGSTYGLRDKFGMGFRIMNTARLAVEQSFPAVYATVALQIFSTPSAFCTVALTKTAEKSRFTQLPQYEHLTYRRTIILHGITDALVYRLR